MSMYGHGHSNLNVSGLSDLDVSHLNLSNHHNNNTNPFENSELYTKSGKLRKVKETKKTVKNEKGKGGKNGLSQGNNGNDGEYEYNYNGGYEEDEGLQVHGAKKSTTSASGATSTAGGQRRRRKELDLSQVDPNLDTHKHDYSRVNGSHSTPHHQYPHSSSTYSGTHSGGRFSHDMDMDLGLYGNEGLFDELEGLDGPQSEVKASAGRGRKGLVQRRE
eukprot:gene22879-25914_t